MATSIIRVVTTTETKGLDGVVKKLDTVVKTITRTRTVLQDATSEWEKFAKMDMRNVQSQINSLNRAFQSLTANQRNIQMIGKSVQLPQTVQEITSAVRAAEKELNRFNIRGAEKELQTARKAFNDLKLGLTEAKTAAKQADKDFAATGNQIAKLSAEVRGLKPRDIKLIANSAQLKSELNGVQTGLQEARRALNLLDGDKAKTELNKAKQGFEDLKAHIQEARRETQNAERQTATSTSNMAAHTTKSIRQMIKDWAQLVSQVGTAVRQIGQAMMNAGMTLSLYTAGMGLALKNAITDTADWGQTMAALAAVTGKPKTEIDQLGQSILDMSKKYTFGANAMASATLYVVEAGFDLNAAMVFAGQGAALTTAIFDGAERTEENYRQTTLNLSKAMRAFNPELLQNAQTTGDWSQVQAKAAEMSDLMATVMNNSAVRASDFNEALEMFFPTAKLLGMNFQEVAVAIGLVSDAGVDGSRAGRELGSALLTMTQDSDKVNEAFSKIGVSIMDEKGQFKDLKTLIGELNKAFFDPETAMKNMATASTEATGKISAAMEEATDKTANFRRTQLENAQRIRDEVASLGGRSAEEEAAYAALQKAMQGSSTEVEANLRALEANSGLLDKISPRQAEWLKETIAAAKAANAAQKAYEEEAKGIEGLITKNGEISEVERLRIMRSITTAAGLRALEPLIEGGASAWERYEEALKKGVKTEDLANDKMKNFKDSVGKLKSSLGATMIRALEPIIEKYLIPLVNLLQKAVDWFDKLGQPIKEIIIAIAALATAIGPLLFVGGSLLFTVGMLMQGLAGLATVLPILVAGFLPIGVALLGIAAAAAVAAGSLWAIVSGSVDLSKFGITNANDFEGKLKELAGTIRDKVLIVVDGLKEGVIALGKSFLENINWEQIKQKFEELKKALQNFLKMIFGEDAFQEIPVGNIGLPSVEANERGVQGKTTTKFAESMKSLGEQMGKALANAFTFATSNILDAITKVTLFLTTEIPMWIQILRENQPQIQEANDNLAKAFLNLRDALSGLGLGEMPSLTQILRDLEDISLDTLAQKINGLATALNNLSAAIKSFQAGDIKWILELNDAAKALMGGPSLLPPGTELNWLEQLRKMSGTYEEGGGDIPTLLKNWLGSWFPQLKQESEKAGQDAGDAFNNGFGGRLGNPSYGGVSSNGAVTGPLTPLLNAIRKNADEFKEVGSMLMNKIGEGLTAAAGNVISAMLNEINNMIQAAKNAINNANLAPDKPGGTGTKPPGAGEIPFAASGGRTLARQPVIVGDTGPEIFVPQHSGMILPNPALGALMGAGISAGSPVSVNVNASGLSRDELHYLAYDIAHEIQQRQAGW